MTTAFLHFIGVNAYFFETGRLRVVMPNATKLGTSPKGPLDAHRPLLWKAANQQGDPAELPKEFLWERLTFNFVPVNPAIPPTALASNITLPPNRFKVFGTRWEDGTNPPDPLAVSGQVELLNGARVSGPVACVRTGWTPPPPPADSVDIAAVRSDLVFRIDGISHVEAKRKGQVGQSPTPASWWYPTPPPGGEIHLFVGNVCSCRFLTWQANNRPNQADDDFRWLYVLESATFDPAAPVPVLSQTGCKVGPLDTPGQIILNGVASGGGGCGCECQGCLAEWK